MPQTRYITTVPTADRSDTDGTFGYRFTPARTVRVAALGRASSAALSDKYEHRIAIWRASDNQLMGPIVTITASSPTDANSVPYESVPETFQLFEGVQYVIGSEEFDTSSDSDNDAWKDAGAALVADADYPATIARIDQAAYRAGSWGAPDTAGTAGAAFGYPTFYVADLLAAFQPWRGW